jgi:hypothetical protein
MDSSSHRWGGRARLWAVVAAGVALAGVIVWQASYAAFSAAPSGARGHAPGRVVLHDSDRGKALFSAGNLRPGSHGVNCVAVTASGSIRSTVRLYATHARSTKGLSQFITLTIIAGRGRCQRFTPLRGESIVYSGTLANFARSVHNFRTGVGTWTPPGTAPQTRTFRLVYRLSPRTPNREQGGRAALSFIWEAQA